MQRRSLVAAATAVPVALAAPALAQTLPEIRWRLTSSFPRSLDITYSTSEYMCRAVSEITDGRFRIQPFPAGELVPGLQAMDAVQSGIPAGCSSPARTARWPSPPPCPSC
jgi:TRAP-type mannitol/chloroaromatic compound transport system substrate-binding protein